MHNMRLTHSPPFPIPILLLLVPQPAGGEAPARPPVRAPRRVSTDAANQRQAPLHPHLTQLSAGMLLTHPQSHMPVDGSRGDREEGDLATPSFPLHNLEYLPA